MKHFLQVCLAWQCVAQPLPPLPTSAIADDPPASPTVRLSWDPSPSPLVAGYRIHRGTQSGAYTWQTNAGTNLVLSVPIAPQATNYFAATAYDAQGLESDYSNELLVHPTAPAPPTLNGRMLVTVMFDWSTNGTTYTPGTEPARVLLRGVPPQAIIRPRTTIEIVPEVEP
jgi:hypothetical protein